MNEDHTNLNPVGDELLEARMIAWILGQSSSFEAEELEKICEAQPEWRVYQRRMLALHGLLEQAQQSSASETWKLSPRRRSALDGILGAAETIQSPVTVRRKTPLWQRISAYAALFVVLASLALFSVAVTGKVGQKAPEAAMMDLRQERLTAVAKRPEDAFHWSYDVPTEPAAMAPMPSAAPADAMAVHDAAKPSEPVGLATAIVTGGAVATKSEEASPLEKSKDRQSDDYAYAKNQPQATTLDGAAFGDKSASELSFKTKADQEQQSEQKGAKELTVTRSMVMEGAKEDVAANSLGELMERGVSDGEPVKTLRGLIDQTESEVRFRSSVRAGTELNEAPQALAKSLVENPTQPELPAGQKGNVGMLNGGADGGVNFFFDADLAKDQSVSESASTPGDLVVRREEPVPGNANTIGGGAGTLNLTTNSAFNLTGGQAASDLKVTGNTNIPTDDLMREQGQLEKVVIEQSDKVEELRKSRDQLLRRAPALVRDSTSASSPVENPVHTWERKAEEATTKLADLTQTIDALNNLDFEEAIRKAAFSEGASQEMQNSFSEYTEIKGQLRQKEAQRATGNDVDLVNLTQSLEKIKADLQSQLGEQKKSIATAIEENQKQMTEATRGLEDSKKMKLEYAKEIEKLAEKQELFESEREKLEDLKRNLESLKKDQPESNKPNLAMLNLQEITTAAEPYSTFSLRVSDASFKLAQAALARNERPAPESVRVEEFYNAFDYGDPVPSAAEPVSCFMEQSAHPVLPARNLLRVSMRTAAAGRGAGQPLHLTLLVDQSGSMVRADRSEVMNSAIAELTTLLGPQDQISIIGFARTPRLVAENIPGNEGERIRTTLQNIPSDGGTNLEEAMKLAEQIAKRNFAAGSQNRILLMTDGAANLGNANPATLATRVKELRQQGLAFDIAGIGTDGLNDDLLLELARHGNGRYYVVNQVADAGAGFAQQLAGAFRPAAENVKVQVHFNPERVQSYQLLGFEKDRLKTEDFRNDAVDAAELAAAEAGNAMYQVALLPEGSGDIGEVSVRFRDTATSQMVERKWTIQYQTAAPAFDQAAPSMKLAGLALLSAEKLKGSGMGEMVQFRDWLALRTQVQDQYRQNARVAELLEMIRKLEN